ncbi:MAG TPA: dihydropteroate synthase-like protein [Candidatus Desulfaltia sp.]|nr:dihydropteroate synthase-like protein [Candidatus Desulfaltia sp.]
MRVLVLTGRLAEEAVRRTVEGMSDVDVLALPVSVASFLTPRYVANVLGKMSLNRYDMILIPGTVSGDVSCVEEATGVPTFKGPVHFVDLPMVLSSNIQLSKTVPASDFIRDLAERRASEEIEAAENDWADILRLRGGITLGEGARRLPVSDGLPMRVLAEVVNAPTLTLKQIVDRAKYYQSQGAQVIDIGMLAGNPRPETLAPIIDALRDAVDLPLSVDTLDPSEIRAAVDAGIDMILSVDAGNLDAAAPHIGDQAVVVLPTDMSRGHLPRTAGERVHALAQNIERARELGLNKIIGDLVVEPLLRPGLLTALESYRLFKNSHPEVPLLFGIGNATELIDADSTGVNAALTALAREAGACMLHVPEYSVKARGSVAEVVRASRMMYVAERRGSVLKDLGLDLLVLKEKRWKEEAYEPGVEASAEMVHGSENDDYKPDEAGWFKVQVDRGAGKIVALHYPPGRKEPATIVKGGDAREVYQTIVRLGLVTKLDHAAYLGKELAKASIALRLGRSYQQDVDLFG